MIHENKDTSLLQKVQAQQAYSARSHRGRRGGSTHRARARRLPGKCNPTAMEQCNPAERRVVLETVPVVLRRFPGDLFFHPDELYMHYQQTRSSLWCVFNHSAASVPNLVDSANLNQGILEEHLFGGLDPPIPSPPQSPKHLALGEGLDVLAATNNSSPGYCLEEHAGLLSLLRRPDNRSPAAPASPQMRVIKPLHHSCLHRIQVSAFHPCSNMKNRHNDHNHDNHTIAFKARHINNHITNQILLEKNKFISPMY